MKEDIFGCLFCKGEVSVEAEIRLLGLVYSLVYAPFNNINTSKALVAITLDTLAVSYEYGVVKCSRKILYDVFWTLNNLNVPAEGPFEDDDDALSNEEGLEQEGFTGDETDL